MANPSPKSAQPNMDTLKQQLERLEADLSAQRRSLNRSATLTALLGLIIIGALAFYFYYGYTEIAYATEPERIVDLGESLVIDNLPKARASLEKEVDKNADKWAESLSKKARASLPDLRVKAENYFVEQVDKSLDESAVLTDQHFRRFVKENRPQLEKAFKDLEKNPKLADEALADLEKALELELQADLQMQAAATFEALTQLNDKLKKLRAGKNLSLAEQNERDVVMIIRRLQLENPGTNLPRIKTGLEPSSSAPVPTGPANAPKPPVGKVKETEKAKDAPSPQKPPADKVKGS